MAGGLQGCVNLAGGGAAVQGIEMDAGRTVFQQVDALRGGVGDSQFHDGVGIVATAVELFGEVEGYGGATADHETLNLRGIGDGHDSGNDGHFNPDAPGTLDEFEIVAVVEEKLGDDEIQAFVPFSFEIHQIDG